MINLSMKTPLPSSRLHCAVLCGMDLPLPKEKLPLTVVMMTDIKIYVILTTLKIYHYLWEHDISTIV